MTFHQSYNEGTLNEMLLEVLITVFTVSPPLLFLTHKLEEQISGCL